MFEKHLFTSSPGKSRCVACTFIRFKTGVRETLTNLTIEMSRAERLLSYSLLALITAKPLASASTTTLEDEDEIPPLTDNGKGAMNADGAWCWREGCAGEFKRWHNDVLQSPTEVNPSDCLKLTKSMQKTADTLQSVADMYDDHARRTQLITHEALNGVSHPYTTYAVSRPVPTNNIRIG